MKKTIELYSLQSSVTNNVDSMWACIYCCACFGVFIHSSRPALSIWVCSCSKASSLCIYHWCALHPALTQHLSPVGSAMPAWRLSCLHCKQTRHASAAILPGWSKQHLQVGSEKTKPAYTHQSLFSKAPSTDHPQSHINRSPTKHTTHFIHVSQLSTNQAEVYSRVCAAWDYADIHNTGWATYSRHVFIATTVIMITLSSS